MSSEARRRSLLPEGCGVRRAPYLPPAGAPCPCLSDPIWVDGYAPGVRVQKTGRTADFDIPRGRNRPQDTGISGVEKGDFPPFQLPQTDGVEKRAVRVHSPCSQDLPWSVVPPYQGRLDSAPSSQVSMKGFQKATAVWHTACGGAYGRSR